MALDGNHDGMQYIREILLSAPECLARGGFVALETNGQDQVNPKQIISFMFRVPQ